MKKYIIAAGVVTVIAGAGIVGVSTANAMNGKSATLADRLASTFQLDASKVQEVMDKHHKESHAQYKAEVKQQRENALKQLVSDGVVTQQQADALKEKRAEQRKERKEKRESMKNMSPRERADACRENRKADRAEMKAWAQQQGIDLEKVREAMHDFDAKGARHALRHMDIPQSDLAQLEREMKQAGAALDAQKQ